MSNYTISTEHQAELFAALAKAQQVMSGATKDATNPHFGNKYADLASVWDAAREPLAANGLSVLQPVSADGAKVTVTTILAHISGGWIASDLTMTTEKATPQGIGSCITYGRRYGLSAMVGISPEDDDGQLASTGSKAAQDAIVARKTAKKPEPEQPQATNYKFLEACAEMKKTLGDKLYYACLKQNGFAKSTLITDRKDEISVYRQLGEIKKVVDAVAVGVLPPSLNAEVFAAIPEKHVSAALKSMRDRLSKGIGSAESATEEYETLRGGSATQYDFFVKLAGACEYYEAQHVA